jgi:pyruvate/2-oxoglutarate dehydrogenase complex dihydrolipoamide dehydrogenase (E3) component
MEQFDIAIIGTGSGNSILDERYADKRIAICEQGVFGGTCLNVGCIPTKMFVYAADVAHTVRESARFGVDAHIDGNLGIRLVPCLRTSSSCPAGSSRWAPRASTRRKRRSTP